MTDRAISVSELNEYARKLLAGDPLLRRLTVRGEISGWKRHISGHCYFTLKDEGARVQCAMFRQYAAALTFRPEDGMRVSCLASASIYPRDGSFQLYVTAIKKEGAGDLYLAFEAMKQKLLKEGLFDDARKRPLPMLPKYIGVATSETGAAVRDIIKVARKRNPKQGIILAPCAVQGAGAAEEIARAIERLNEDGRSDVILVGRGGGSMEDLWCFNEEIVARAIAASRIPVISCVGHEVDFTISDFVADARAATPSAAAEMAVPVAWDLKNDVTDLEIRLTRALLHGQTLRRAKLEKLENAPVFSMPRMVLLEKRQAEMEKLAARLEGAVQKMLTDKRSRLEQKEAMLRALSPLSVLERGYAIVRGKDGCVRSSDEVAPGDKIDIRFARGSAGAVIEEVQK